MITWLIFLAAALRSDQTEVTSWLKSSVNKQNGWLSWSCYYLLDYSPSLLLLFNAMRCRLTQFFSMLMRSTQFSNTAVSKMLLIFRRRHRARRHRNRPQVWVYPRNEHWFEEIIRNPAMHRFWKEHFRMNLDSFQEFCRVLSPLMLKRDTHFRAAVPLEKRVAIGLWRLATGESYRSASVTFGVGKCTALNIVHEFFGALIHVREDYLSHVWRVWWFWWWWW